MVIYRLCCVNSYRNMRQLILNPIRCMFTADHDWTLGKSAKLANPEVRQIRKLYVDHDPLEPRNDHPSSPKVEGSAGFRDLSKQWWDKAGPLAALHTMNHLRVPWIVSTINGGRTPPPTEKGDLYLPLEGTRILDVGCGGGILCEPLSRLGAQVTGIDEEQLAIEVAQERSVGEGLDIDYRNQSVSGLCSKIGLQKSTDESGMILENSDLQFDAVVASEVIEHVQAQMGFCVDLAKLVKPGGHVFLTTLNQTWASQVLGIYLAEGLGVVPRGIHDWNLFISPTDLEGLLRSAGLSTTMVHGMAYNPLWNEWSWSGNQLISYALHAVK